MRKYLCDHFRKIKQRKTWENAFSKGESTSISSQSIINEYKAKFAKIKQGENL